MGFGAARILLRTGVQARTHGLLLFLVQLAFNFFWSIIFFNLQNFGFALIWLIILWLLILWMIFSFRKVDSSGGMAANPSISLVTFAAYLNFGVWILN
jgi:tryptophan-rich sensory protein